MDRFSVDVACGKGIKRANNEDNFCVNEFFLDESAVEKSEEEMLEYRFICNGGLFTAVCDGMGGEAAGELASRIAAGNLTRVSTDVDEEGLFSALRDISTLVAEGAKQIGAIRIGCTAAVLRLFGGKAMIANVGDSRVYHFHKRKLCQISHDQSEVQMYVDSGLLSEKQARSHPMRHRILQFLGMPVNMLEFETAKYVDYSPGDVFLICSDGLTECVDNDRIEAMLRAEASSAELYVEAMKNGGVDNTTIILARVE